MKRVLQVFDSLEISGGVQGVVMNTYRRIDKSIVQFDFAVYDAPQENSYQKEIEDMGGRVFEISNLSDAGVLGFYRQFIDLYKSNKYDAVHAHNIHHNGIILYTAKKAGIPIRISHSHQSFDERNESFARRAFAHILKSLNNIVATRKVACSDLAGNFLYGNSDFEFLPNAVDISRFSSLPDKETLRKQYGYDCNKIILLHIGRFCYQKNQKFLVNIMERLDKDQFVLILVGDGDLKEDVLKLFHKMDNVFYLGLRQDIPSLLKLSDYLLLPSIYEGLPLVVVEAQAAGCQSLISSSITKQTDLGMNLVKYLPINIEEADLWIDEITNKKTVSYDLNVIYDSLKRLKFDVNSNLQAWYDLYGE